MERIECLLRQERTDLCHLGESKKARALYLLPFKRNGPVQIAACPQPIMRGYSDCHMLIQERFLVLLWMELSDLDEMIDATLFKLKPLNTKAELL
ncbi:hypothetical protein VP01_2324g1 [Puccinia sorghi]|uniref:Uncharacterized protein n=1 Tax=Puccinia sorghi TaxID=27349 RepID=A0A0L6V7Q7_9BASI|nr:hypothetical protein VP01_2324g1 [Puccinia sorghi]